MLTVKQKQTIGKIESFIDINPYALIYHNYDIVELKTWSLSIFLRYDGSAYTIWRDKWGAEVCLEICDFVK